MTNTIKADQRLLLLTDLPIWSLKKSSGARSFHETLSRFNNIFNMEIATSEKGVNEFNTVFLKHINPHRLTNISILKLILKPLLWVLNFIYTYKYLKKNIHCYDIVYCYEIAHVVAAMLVVRNTKFKGLFVTRFQGTILTPVLDTKNVLSKFFFMIRHFDHVAALKSKSDLIVMTDDGTKGNEVLTLLGNHSQCLFLRNGVDVYGLRKKEYNFSKLNFVTCSRLVQWKRVDRAIDIFSKVLNFYPDAKLDIIGSGPCEQSLMDQCGALEIKESVTFHGALSHYNAIQIMHNANIMLSCFSLSNVGNPLWEAQALGLWVATLNNGDTAKYIENGINGFIVDEENYVSLANKLIKLREANKEHINFEQNYLLGSWSIRIEKELKCIQLKLSKK